MKYNAASSHFRVQNKRLCSNVPCAFFHVQNVQFLAYGPKLQQDTNGSFCNRTERSRACMRVIKASWKARNVKWQAHSDVCWQAFGQRLITDESKYECSTRRDATGNEHCIRVWLRYIIWSIAAPWTELWSNVYQLEKYLKSVVLRQGNMGHLIEIPYYQNVIICSLS